jgi:dihydroorotase
VHGEVTSQAVDIFEREAAFIDSEMRPLVNHSCLHCIIAFNPTRYRSSAIQRCVW